jgi:hypothetical protein
MSVVVKLLSRIVAPNIEDGVNNNKLHDHTYGITSDPLTRLSIIFSILIHDVDHTGVSNLQLVKENSPVAKLYKKDKSALCANMIYVIISKEGSLLD